MFKVEGKVNMFPGLSGWHWVGVPSPIAYKIRQNAPTGSWRFLPIYVKLGKTEWKTALLPLGEGKFFVALKAKVRKSESVIAGDVVTLGIRV